MNRRQMFSTTAQLLLGLAGIVAARRLATDVEPETSYVDQNRQVHILLRSEPLEEFQKMVVKTVVDDVKRNGPMRGVIASTLEG